jgi:ATP/maltotriose-dependent transcriptional regulator MalT
MSDSHHLERARASCERRAWADAYEAFSIADEAAPLGAADLDLLALAAALVHRDDTMLSALERAYQAHVEVGDEERAARAAFWLGFRLHAMGESGRATGWLARAQRLVERRPDGSVVAGYLLLPTVYRHLALHEYDAAAEAAARALNIGERFGETDLIAFAQNLQGRTLIARGQIERGLALFDEVMLTSTAGRVNPIFTALIYCSVLAGYQQVYALDRAREWSAAFASWSAAQPQLIAFAGTCLVHRAEILQMGGDWAAAIEEARRASAKGRESFAPGAAGDGHYQLAEIHRLRGEHAEAEEAYRRASELGREPHPGLALLRLAQGQRDAAATAMRRVVGAVPDPMKRIHLLPAYVEVMLAAGDLDEARRASSELEQIATRFQTEVLRAMADHAAGSVRLAEGNAQAAVEPLRRAHRVWQQVGAPYIAAKIRVLLACACQALGDDDGATLEADAARATFERLGAAPDIAALDALLAEPAAPASTHGLTGRELQVLRLVAAGKTNKGIAHELCISEKTVDRHVSNIFSKLDVATRAAATAFAYEHHLV